MIRAVVYIVKQKKTQQLGRNDKTRVINFKVAFVRMIRELNQIPVSLRHTFHISSRLLLNFILSEYRKVFLRDLRNHFIVHFFCMLFVSTKHDSYCIKHRVKKKKN